MSAESTESQPATGGIRPDLWSRTYQIGVVVRDIEKAAAFYESLGIGPFTEGPSAHTLVRKIYGDDAPDVSVKGLIAQMGSVEFELLQPVAGKGIQAEFLERHGEGVVHLCAYTDDIDRDIADLTGLGHEVISYGEVSDGGRFAYFETREVGGLVLELFQPGETFT
ncbi:MAG: VOC family protein [bacterium]|nr:VOC family protein [bacterium]